MITVTTLMSQKKVFVSVNPWSGGGKKNPSKIIYWNTDDLNHILYDFAVEKLVDYKSFELSEY